jgi:excisionase family DNA binding protein
LDQIDQLSPLTNNSDAPATTIRTFTRKEAAEILGVSQSTLDVMTKAGKIGVCRVGRRRLYLERHLTEFLNSTESKAA